MNTNTQNTSNTSNKALIVLFVMFLLSSASMFAQNTATAVAAPVTTTTVEVLNVSVNQIALGSDVEFMSWFMSSKQTQSVNGGSEGTSSTTMSRKKQIISSGVVPNKVLYRTLVKKVISQESAIA
jgi:hypothetical protein